LYIFNEAGTTVHLTGVTSPYARHLSYLIHYCANKFLLYLIHKTVMTHLMISYCKRLSLTFINCCI